MGKGCASGRRGGADGCSGGRDTGLLVMRLGLGAVLMAHGAQKLFGWFGGSGIEGTAGGMESMGFEPGRESAIAAGLGEAGGGALLAVGLATPAAGAAAAGAMAAATAVHWEHGLFGTQGGFEFPLLLGLGSVGLGLTGAGSLSLDEATGRVLDKPWITAGAFVATAAVASAMIAKRNRVVEKRAGAAEEKQREAEAAGNRQAQ